MKKTIALIMSLVLVICCFAGCGAEKTVVGKWELDMKVMDAVAAAGEDMSAVFGAEFTTDAAINGITVEFTEDGNTNASVDSEQIKTSVKGFFDEFIAFLKNGGIYNILEAQSGMGREQIEAALEAQGMNLDDVCDTFTEYLDLDSMTKSIAENFADDAEDDGNGKFVRKSTYEVKNNQIIIDGEAADFTLSEDGDTLTITENSVPMIFRRVG